MAVKLSAEERKEIITDLVTNCDCWAGDHELLGTFSDTKLAALKANEEKLAQVLDVANAAVEGFVDEDGTALRINPETGVWQKRQLTDAEISQLAANKKKMLPDDGVTDDDEDLEGEEGYLPPKRGKKPMTKNRRQVEDDDDEPAYQGPRTRDEFLRAMPADMRQQLQAADAIVNREKDTIISQLLVNVAESDRVVHREKLQNRNLDDLQLDLARMPKPPKVEDVDQLAHNAQAARNERRQQRINPSDDMLVTPKIDWQDAQASNQVGGRKKVSNEVHSSQMDDDDDSQGGINYDDMDDQEILNHLPAKMRETFKNASAIENREKTKLIDELISNANLVDDVEERRLRQRMNNKPLSELRDYQLVSPKKEQGRTNYFGAAASPMGRAHTSVINENDDVLPLPVTDWKSVSKNGE